MAHLGGMIFGYLYLKRPRRRSASRGPGIRDYYDKWRRDRLRKKFEAYYEQRQARQKPNGGNGGNERHGSDDRHRGDEPNGADKRNDGDERDRWTN
jgi:hypothetical protein